MIEIIKEAGAILKDLPDLAIWILIGILFYKTVIIGSIFSVTKLLINKVHDAITKPKVIEKKVTLDDMFITHDGTYEKFKSIISEMIYYNGGDASSKGRFLHSSDVEFIKQAIIEKRKRDNEKN